MQARIGWIDTAKGAAILLVVLWHAYLTARMAGGLPDRVASVSLALSSLRMPVFFLTSGMVLALVLRRPLPQVMRRRVLPMLWILVLWTALGSAINALVPLYPWDAAPLPGVEALLWAPQGNLWFVYALMAYCLMARMVMAQDGWRRAALVAAFFAALVANEVLQDGFVSRNLVQYYPFFMLGVLGFGWIERATRTGRRIALVGLACIAGLALLEASGLPGLAHKAGASVLGAGLGVAVAAGLRRLPLIALWLDAAGRRSLAIYLGHQPVLAVSFALVPFELLALAPLATWLGLAALAVSGALLAERLVQRAGLGWLYRVPEVVVARLIAPLRAARLA